MEHWTYEDPAQGNAFIESEYPNRRYVFGPVKGSPIGEVDREFAPLAASAPALLEALERIKSRSCCAAETFDDNISRDTPQNTMNELLTINELARAAIEAAK